MEETVSAGGVVLNADREVALVRHGDAEPAWWGFPKGHIDPGEDAITAAKREIQEETGLRDLAPVKELGSYSRYKGSADGSDDMSEMKTMHMFLFTTNEERLAPEDPHHPEARWVPLERVAATLSNEKDRAFFVRIMPEIDL